MLKKGLIFIIMFLFLVSFASAELYLPSEEDFEEPAEVIDDGDFENFTANGAEVFMPAGYFLMNASVTDETGIVSGRLNTSYGISNDAFNISVYMNMSDRSSTLSGTAPYYSGSLMLANMSDATQYHICGVYNMSGGLTLAYANDTCVGFCGSTAVTSLEGLLSMTYNGTHFNCSFAGEEVLSQPAEDIGYDFNLNLYSELYDSGNTFSGEMNISYTNYSYAVFDYITLNDCQDIWSEGTYKLSTNVTATETCMELSENNILFDGQGYYLLGNGTGNGFEFTESNSENTTIKNIKVNGFTYGITGMLEYTVSILDSSFYNSSSIAIYFTGAAGLLLNNSKIYDNLDDGFFVEDLANSTFSDNIFYNNTDGLEIIESSFTNTNITIRNNSIYRNTESGLEIQGSENVTVSNNNFSINTKEGAYFVNCNNITFFNNTAHTNTEEGLYTTTVDNSNFSYNEIYDNGYNAMKLQTSDNNYMGFNSLYENGYAGLDSRGNDNLVSKSDKVYSNLQYGITFYGTTNNQFISNGTIYDNTLNVFDEGGENHNITFINSNLSFVSGKKIVQAGTNPLEVLFYNTSFAKSTTSFFLGSGANLTNYYYLTFNVSNSSNSVALESATVNLTDSDGTYISSTTDVEGLVTFTLPEFFQNTTGRYYYNDYTVNVTLSGYATNDSETLNLSLTNSTSSTILLGLPSSDSEEPTFDEFPIDQSIDFGDSFSYIINASDETEFDSFSVNDTTTFQIGASTGLLTNKTALSASTTYWLNITINDSTGNENSTVFGITVGADPLQMECQEVTEDLTLTSNITATGTCLNVTVDNVTIDGAGFWLNGAGVGAGINFSSVDNILITNITVSGFDDGLLQGGDMVNVTLTQSRIRNMVSTCLDFGDSLQNSTFSDSSFINCTFGVEAVFFEDASNVVFSSNNISNSGEDGLAIESSSDLNLSYNRIENISGIGVELSEVNDSLFNSNVLFNITNKGFDFGACYNNNLTNNLVYDVVSYAIKIGSSNGFLMEGNTFYDSEIDLIRLYGAGTINFTNDNFSTVDGYSIFDFGGSESQTLNLFNVTMNNKSAFDLGGSDDQVYNYYYVDMNITNNSFSPLSSSKVVAVDSASTQRSSNTTNAGLARLTLLSFYENNTARYYYNNYSLTAYLENYTSNSTSLNLSFTNSTSSTILLGTNTVSRIIVGNILYPNGSYVNSANVTFTEDGQSPAIETILTNSDGEYTIELNASKNYWLTINKYSGVSNVTHVGPSNLPPLSGSMVNSFLSGENLSLQEAANIVVYAWNGSDNVNFSGMAYDANTGMPYEEQFSSSVGVESMSFSVASNRNVSVLLYMFDNEQFTTYKGSLTTLNYSGSPKYVFANFSVSPSEYILNGSVKYPNGSAIPLTNLVLHELSTAFDSDMAPTMFNLPAKNSDVVDSTNGNYSVTLNANMEYLLAFYANDSSDYYAYYLPINYSTAVNRTQNITLREIADGASVDYTSSSANSSMTPIYIKDESGNLISNAFVLISTEYNNSIAFQPASASTYSSFAFYNDTSVDIKVFSGNFEPKLFKINSTVLNTNNTLNFTLTTMSKQDFNGSSLSGNLGVSFYTTNSTCDVYGDVPSACLVSSFSDSTDFSPLKIMTGEDHMSVRIVHNVSNVVVHYVNVDMMMSGPPSASFDSSSTTSSLTEARRIGSSGPDIYEEILVGMPYTQGSFSESGAITFQISELYDHDLTTLLWESSSNTVDEVPSSYSDYNSEFFSGKTCSKTNTSDSCYVDTSANIVWITIPHFSGYNGVISGVSSSSSSSSGSSGGKTKSVEFIEEGADNVSVKVSTMENISEESSLITDKEEESIEGSSSYYIVGALLVLIFLIVFIRRMKKK